MRRTIRLLVLAQALVWLPLAACDRTGSQALPWGLDGVTHPSDEASVRRALEAMPTAVAGRERSASSDPFRVSYGEHGIAGLRALRLGEAAKAEGFPATAGDYIRSLADSGEVEIEAQRLDPGSGLVYLVCTTTTSEEAPGGATVDEMTEFFLGWGDQDSEWLFAVSADSPEVRTALVEAYLDAVRSSR